MIVEQMGERDRVCVPVFGLLDQRPENDIVDPRRQIELRVFSGQPGRRLLQVRSDDVFFDFLTGAAGKRWRAGQHLVDDTAERVNIGGGTDRVAARLLWRQVSGGPERL